MSEQPDLQQMIEALNAATAKIRTMATKAAKKADLVVIPKGQLEAMQAVCKAAEQCRNGLRMTREYRDVIRSASRGHFKDAYSGKRFLVRRAEFGGLMDSLIILKKWHDEAAVKQVRLYPGRHDGEPATVDEVQNDIAYLTALRDQLLAEIAGIVSVDKETP